MRNNLTLARLFRRNMQSLGRRIQLTHPESSVGSTDMGNVSQLVPSIHPIVAIAPPETPHHSTQFAEIAASEAGQRGLVDAAKALALTVVDLVSHPEIVIKIREEFERAK